MRVAADEMIGAPGVALGIPNGIELVFRKMAVHARLGSGSEGKDCGGLAAVQAWAGNEEFEP